MQNAAMCFEFVIHYVSIGVEHAGQVSERRYINAVSRIHAISQQEISCRCYHKPRGAFIPRTVALLTPNTRRSRYVLPR